MFTGLSAFPLTPLREDRLDAPAFERIVRMLAGSGVDSITMLGSTGSYAYLDRGERQEALATALAAAGETPVIAGIGALRTSAVLDHAQDAQDAGAQALLLAPMTYQALTEDDVFGLFSDVLERVAVPVVVYDNPGTTHFRFSDALYGRLAALPGIASIKIPGIPAGITAAERLAQLRDVVPPEVTIGISGDAFAADALRAGCEAWYSVIAGTLPGPALRIARAALGGDPSATAEAAAAMRPLWSLFARHGSLRVVAAIAEERGLVRAHPLPLPIRGLGERERAHVREALAAVPGG
ncbi:dihydrodipicolinate synthase family protein [Agrococcus baldri]|uniref:Dihydrodipicolinate synthase family protein n=1 Tax=Agrococcus baldri TaxID=153730 RepID=A0AA87RIW3_9MICO|nr:dihydrodipicolinate synthase family protein [Agrococcus baldri]GEK80193.1 dihydrodipicolinate synthase family protein [Agrococcus baldri]